MLASIWCTRLEKRLAALADAASKESIQTLSRWITFNRKHALYFNEVLKANMLSKNTTTARLWLYWQLIDQILVQDKDNATKFDRYGELRILVGDQIVISAAKRLSEKSLLDKVKPLFEQWDTVNVFGGPTLMNQIKRAAESILFPPKRMESESGNKQKKGSLMEKTSDKVFPELGETPRHETSPMSNSSITTKVNTRRFQDASIDVVMNPLVSSNDQRHHTVNSIVSIDFDFEKAGIPHDIVEAREFLEPCKAVATLQITRDLRSESTVQLKSWFQSIPKDIREEMRSRYEEETRVGDGKLSEIDEKKVEHYSLGLSREILDLNIEESLENVRSFRDIVKKLKTARKKLINLLIKSRCKFGSDEAAQAFLRSYKIARKAAKTERTAFRCYGFGRA